MQFIQHYATLHCVQEIYFASVSNIDSAVAGTRNIPGAEAFILWLQDQLSVEYSAVQMRTLFYLAI